MSDKRRVVVDVDVGTDDAFAILVLLYAEKINQIKIEAIVCTAGNASLKDVSKNTVRILELLNRTDIPIYKGAVESIIPPDEPLKQFHGKDGFGDLEHATEPDVSIIKTEPAAVAIRKLIVDNPKQITLVCVGPLTNAALSMKLYNDCAPNIKDFFILGGNYAATGNITETAEFNFYADPEGASIVLEKAPCPITIATWETCLDTNITFGWRYRELGMIKNAFIDLLNRAERSIYSEVIDPNEKWYPCDVFIVAAMLFPKEVIVRKSNHNATVELHGSKTRGQIVLDHLKLKNPNVIVIEQINCEYIKELLLKAAASF